jgi:hypothetical protein
MQQQRQTEQQQQQQQQNNNNNNNNSTTYSIIPLQARVGEEYFLLLLINLQDYSSYYGFYNSSRQQ